MWSITPLINDPFLIGILSRWIQQVSYKSHPLNWGDFCDFHWLGSFPNPPRYVQLCSLILAMNTIYFNQVLPSTMLIPPSNLMMMNQLASISQQRLLLNPRQIFDEDVSNLEISGNMGQSNDLAIKGFLNVVAIHLKIFCSPMEDWISCNLNGAYVVCMKRSGRLLWKSKFFK